MKIPASFRVLGENITVVVDDYIMDREESLGATIPHENKVELCSHVGGKPLPADSVEATFFHELTHVILLKIGYEKLYRDEKFVDLFGRALHQALNSFSGDVYGNC